MTIRKLCYLALGMTGLALGALGAVLPLLPPEAVSPPLQAERERSAAPASATSST